MNNSLSLIRPWFASDGHSNDDPEVQEKMRELDTSQRPFPIMARWQKLKRLADRRLYSQIVCVRPPRQRNDRCDRIKNGSKSRYRQCCSKGAIHLTSDFWDDSYDFSFRAASIVARRPSGVLSFGPTWRLLIKTVGVLCTPSESPLS